MFCLPYKKRVAYAARRRAHSEIERWRDGKENLARQRNKRL
jgi:hypothetical protein